MYSAPLKKKPKMYPSSNTINGPKVIGRITDKEPVIHVKEKKHFK